MRCIRELSPIARVRLLQRLRVLERVGERTEEGPPGSSENGRGEKSGFHVDDPPGGLLFSRQELAVRVQSDFEVIPDADISTAPLCMTKRV